MSLPLRIELGVRYGVQKGVTASHRYRQGQYISGDWAETAKVACGSRSAKKLLEDLVNTAASPDQRGIEAILYFTHKWAPLTSEYEPRKPFEETVGSWCRYQAELKRMWRGLGRAAAPNHWRGHPVSDEIDVTLKPEFDRLLSNWGGFFSPNRTYFPLPSESVPDFGKSAGPKGHLRLGAHTILQFATLSLYALDARYLRLCLRPDCENPYFIADDLRAHFCSDACSQWSRVEWKNRWWREHGKDWRKARAREGTNHKIGRRR